MFMFGGYGGTGRLDDFWEFDFGKASPLLFSPYFRLQGVLAVLSTPGSSRLHNLPRANVQGNMEREKGFGFSDHSSRHDMPCHTVPCRHCYPGTRVWKEVKCHGPSPGVRENNGVVEYKGSLYLFGGYNGSQWLNDFHGFHIGARACKLSTHTFVSECMGKCSCSSCGRKCTLRRCLLFLCVEALGGTYWKNII